MKQCLKSLCDLALDVIKNDIYSWDIQDDLEIVIQQFKMGKSFGLLFNAILFLGSVDKFEQELERIKYLRYCESWPGHSKDVQDWNF